MTKRAGDEPRPVALYLFHVLANALKIQVNGEDSILKDVPREERLAPLEGLREGEKLSAHARELANNIGFVVHGGNLLLNLGAGSGIMAPPNASFDVGRLFDCPP